MSPAARILYIPNESHGRISSGSRRVLKQLVEVGALAEARTFSPQRRLERQSLPEVRRALSDLVAEYKPTTILLQHAVGSGLVDEDYARLRARASFALIYHEIDPYHAVLNPLPRETHAAARHSDVTYSSGAGTFRRAFLRAGARRVEWVPQTYDPGSFGSHPLAASPSRDVVMIANNGVSRNPLRGHPGAHTRALLVRRLYEAFGPRFRIYGSGWSGPYAAGHLPFASQEAVLADARVSVNWDHYPNEPYYFSNRLPISLASGSIHVTTWHEGFDELFPPDADFIRFGTTVNQIVDEVRNALEVVNESQRLELGARGRMFADQRFRGDDLMATLLRGGGVEVPVQAQIAAREVEVDDDNEF